MAKGTPITVTKTGETGVVTQILTDGLALVRITSDGTTGRGAVGRKGTVHMLAQADLTA